MAQAIRVGSVLNGATTDILVGGGIGEAPVWITATGDGAPMRSISPTTTGTMTAEAITASGTVTYAYAKTTEGVYTPTGITQTIACNAFSNVTINLGSASGNVTVTLEIPGAGVSANGRIIAKNGSSPRDITIIASDLSVIRYYGTKEDTSADGANTARGYAWNWDGNNFYIGQTPVTTT